MIGRSQKGLFEPPVGRQSSIVIVTNLNAHRDLTLSQNCADHLIVTTLSTTSTTEVLAVNPKDGELRVAEVYPDEASALSALGRQNYVEVARGAALLGYTATESTAGVLLATRVSTKATLPGGHSVVLVGEELWQLLPLRGPYSDSSFPQPDMSNASTQGSSEVEFWRALKSHTITGTHYYCETADVTRPFPSSHGPADPDPEFVWNSWLARPLISIGLPAHCPALLQGAVELTNELHPTGQRYSLALISRRSRRHPGTRYIARGLNELAGPGNEIEAELLMWTPSLAPAGGASSRPSTHLRWARVMWRRGTVPIWWGVEVQPLNKGLQAEVYVRDSETYVGMLTYFRSLQRLIAGDSGGAKMLHPPVTCINLLHCHPRKAAEVFLSEHFDGGMRHVKERMHPAEGVPPLLTKFDWHGIMGLMTEERGIEAFWQFIEQPVRNVGFALGCMEPLGVATAAAAGEKDGDISPWGNAWQMRWHQRQHGLLRFNCADSLDRTNAATCFAMLPVLQEGLRLLGISLDVSPAAALSGVNRYANLSNAAQQDADEEEEEEVLPEGWERFQHEGRPVYVDHNTRKTQWKPPSGTIHRKKQPTRSTSIVEIAGGAADQPWAFFSHNLSDVQSRLYSNSVVDYVSMFRKHGDVHSKLYTGSPAMHSHVLGLVLAPEVRPYGGASGGVGRLQNLRVAVQRRVQNTVFDTSRQQSIEVFLGMNLEKHCPGLTLGSIVAAERNGIASAMVGSSDLSGIDPDDVFDIEPIHQGKELRTLPLLKHDGRVGVHVDDVRSLEGQDQEDDDELEATAGTIVDENRVELAGLDFERSWGSVDAGAQERRGQDDDDSSVTDPLGVATLLENSTLS